MRAIERTITTQLEQTRILLSSHPLTNFEIQKYHQNELKFNDAFFKIKDRAYVIHFDEFKSIGTHWIALCVNDNNGETHLTI